MRFTPETTATPTSSKEILVIGLNPAFQSTLHFDNFRPGHVNRASRKCNSIGGKGQNFAIACSQYGERDKVTVFQATGGMTGKYISAFLDELKIEHVTIPLSKTTRTCTTVLDRKTGSMTELIEPAGRVEVSEKKVIEESVKQLILNSKKLEGIALCGTLPSGLNGTIYQMIAQTKPKNCLVLMDAYQNTECLNSGNVDILKINAEESRKLVSGFEDTDIYTVGRMILKFYRIKILAITDGPSTAYLFERNSETCKLSKFTIPTLDGIVQNVDMSDSPQSVSSSLPEATGESFQPRSGSSYNLASLGQNSILLLNPLGAGDTCSAIFLLEYLDTKNAPQSFRHGLAAASASCLMLDNTSHFDLRYKKAIFDEISFESVDFNLNAENSNLFMTE